MLKTCNPALITIIFFKNTSVKLEIVLQTSPEDTARQGQYRRLGGREDIRRCPAYKASRSAET